MKKILTILMALVGILFLTIFLYIFGVPPFQAGGPFVQIKQDTSTQATVIQTQQTISEEKINREESYDELIKKADLNEQNGVHEAAISNLDMASKMAPGKTDPLIKIGRIYLRLPDAIKAKNSFKQALSLDPENTEIKIYLVRSLLADRKIAEAKEILDTITNETQNSKYYKGIVATYLGDYDNSKKLLNESLKIQTSEDITAKTQNFLSAYDEFAANSGGKPDHLKTLLARSFNQTGEYQMAIPLLFEVVKNTSDYRDAWTLLGYSYLKIDKYQDAIEALETAKKLDSGQADNLFYLGLGYYGINDLQKAALNLELAKKYGYNPIIHINQKLAEIYLQMKKYKESAENYEAVLALNNSELNYYIKPIWIYVERLNAPDKALTLAQKAIIAHPNTAMGQNLLGWALIYNNKFEEAEQVLNDAKSLNPNLDAVYLNLGLLNEKKGQNLPALEQYKKAFAMGNGNSISSSAAERYNKIIMQVNNLESNSIKANILNNNNQQ